jgi:hypothetical protein
MRQKTSQALYAYWNDLRQGRIAPRRFDVEPARIGHLLPDTFMLECDDGLTYRYRLAGTRLCDQFNVDFRGQDFLSGWTEPNAETLRREFELMTAQGGVVLLTMEAASEEGLRVEFEVVILPLVHTLNRVDRYLGAMTAVHDARGLGSQRLTRKTLLQHEIIWPDGRPHAFVDKAHRQVPFLPTIRQARIVRQDRRQFRVYEGGLRRPDADGPDKL